MFLVSLISDKNMSLKYLVLVGEMDTLRQSASIYIAYILVQREAKNITFVLNFCVRLLVEHLWTYTEMFLQGLRSLPRWPVSAHSATRLLRPHEKERPTQLLRVILLGWEGEIPPFVRLQTTVPSDLDSNSVMEERRRMKKSHWAT